MIHPQAFAQSVGGDDELTTPPQVISAQGALGEALEGPVDPETYILGPSDQLLVILKGPETSLHYLRVFPEGNVILPNYGAFYASGLTLADFAERVREVLRRYYRNVEIDVQLSLPRNFVIYVLGEVQTPGPVIVTTLSRVSHALKRAGEVRGGGSRRLIEIRESGKPTRIVDQFMFLRTGDFDQNPTLKEGQTIFVPLRETGVNIFGEVRRSGYYEVIDGETAADLIEYAGGIGPLGVSERIVRERIKEGKGEPLYTFSLAGADTVNLSDMDIIVVDNIMSYEGSDPVQVVGGGGRTGIFRVSEPEPLREFLFRLGRIDPTSFDIETAVLERPIANSTVSEQIEFNVREVLKGGSGSDMTVQPGDLVVFPPAPNNVFVSGEVVSPGPVPFQPGLTAERYVTLAGGPNNSGSYDKVKIISREGVERKANRDSAVYRGDTIVIGTRTAKKFGAMWIGLVSLTGLVVALVALSNSLND
jgi:protein involved in polysaccharide export with SLBB domain